MADRVSKGAYPQVYGHSRQLWLNHFFDPSTPSMSSKGCDGEEKWWKKKKRIVKIAVQYGCASQPPEQQPTGTPTARSKRKNGPKQNN